MLTKHLLQSRLWIDPGSTPCDPGVDPGSTLKIGIVAQPGRKPRNTGLSALELAVTVDFSGPSAFRPYNPVTLCRVLRTVDYSSTPTFGNPADGTAVS